MMAKYFLRMGLVGFLHVFPFTAQATWIEAIYNCWLRCVSPKLEDLIDASADEVDRFLLLDEQLIMLVSYLNSLVHDKENRRNFLPQAKAADESTTVAELIFTLHFWWHPLNVYHSIFLAEDSDDYRGQLQNKYASQLVSMAKLHFNDEIMEPMRRGLMQTILAHFPERNAVDCNRIFLPREQTEGEGML